MAPSGQNALVYEIHEDRIQNLESCLNETNATLAQQDVKLDHIAKGVDGVKTDMQNKMDKGFSEIKDAVQRTSVQIEKLHGAVQDHDKRIASIERNETERADRWKSVLKVGSILVAALAGALAKQIVDVWFK